MFRKALVGGFLGGFIADALEDVGIMTCKCKPNTPNPWQFVNEDSIVEGAPTLMVCSTLTCRYGGVIEIIDPDGNGDINIPPDDIIEDKELTPEEWEQIENMFPELDEFVQKTLDSAGDAVGLESEVVSVELPMFLPDGSTVTYSTSVTIKADSPDNYITVKSAIAKQLLSIRGDNWSLDSNQNIKSLLGLGLSATVSPDGITFSAKIGENRKLDEFTTLYAPVHSLKYPGFGIMKYSVESKMGVDTPDIRMNASLKWDKIFNSQNSQMQTEPVQEEVPEPKAEQPSAPKLWKQGGWIYNAVENINNGVSSAIDDIHNGLNSACQIMADNAERFWQTTGPILAAGGMTMLYIYIGGMCMLVLI